MITPTVFTSFSNLRCAVSTRAGGVSPEPLSMNLSFKVGDSRSNVEQNRKRFYTAVGIDGDRLAVPHQCHSSRVLYVRGPGEFDAADGLVTDKRNLWLVVTVADCVPVFLFDPKKPAVAGIHAGWRGAAAGIVGRGVQIMEEQCSTRASDILAFIGPSAGSCCYEVGGNVAEQFVEGSLIRKDGRLFLDLKAEVREQLLHRGVAAQNIETSEACTICSPSHQFHSYRRDRERSGRMMGIIGLEA